MFMPVRTWFFSVVRRRNRHRWKKAAKGSGVDKCATKWCRNKRAEKITVYKRKDGTLGRTPARLRHCWKCRSKMLKERQPITYILRMLRHSAKKRGLACSLTKTELAEFCAKTGYLEKRGNQPNSLTIDRIDRDKGYHIWNMQVLTHAENSAQGADNTPRDERDKSQESEYLDGTETYETPSEEPF